MFWWLDYMNLLREFTFIFLFYSHMFLVHPNDIDSYNNLTTDISL